ncbi:MAG: glyceraldehyde 3-phosphate dehydrogenase NAD-binding domain-containing protein [Candidatus Gastranaerophilales bacterium]|nr:glyceraldehyde 3-phosphate dehydrogenase NAD-binding domain-containing protein [Candidatus Gastranaerophilales bacterium]
MLKIMPNVAPATFNCSRSKISFKGNESSTTRPTVNVAINGATGRIGKTFFRECFADHGVGIQTESTDRLKEKLTEGPKINIVAMNVSKKMTPEDLINSLKYDSIMGYFPGLLSAKREDNGKLYLTVAQKGQKPRKIRILETKDMKELPWKELKVDVVVDTTGVAKTEKILGQHLSQGAKKAILSAPAKDDMKTIVYGINDNEVLPTDKLLSNASCTTTAIAPVIKLMDDEYGIESGSIETIHSATSSQLLQDKAPSETDKDAAKLRSSINNMIPTTTGAAKAIVKVLPKLNGKLDGSATRVNTNDVSIANIVLYLNKEVTAEEVKNSLRKASESEKYKDLLAPAHKGATSIDEIGRLESAIYIEDSIKVIGRMVTIKAFYDNEWGYTRSLIDLTKKAGGQIYQQPGKDVTGSKLSISA